MGKKNTCLKKGKGGEIVDKKKNRQPFNSAKCLEEEGNA